MKININGVTREMTTEEIAKQEMEQKHFIQSQGYGEFVESLIRRKYSLSDELSLHRQQFKKPEEFAEYDAYAEQCKAEARILLGGSNDGTKNN